MGLNPTSSTPLAKPKAGTAAAAQARPASITSPSGITYTASPTGGYVDANGNPPTGTDSSWYDNILPSTVTQAIYAGANPIGYGLDKLGIGPSAGLSYVDGGATGNAAGTPIVNLPAKLGIPAPGNILGGGGSTSVDTGAITKNADIAAQAMQQFGSQYQNFQGNTAPTASATQAQAALAAQGAPIQAGQSQAGQAQAAQIANTVLAQKQQAIQAQQVQAAIAQRQANIVAQQVQAAQASRTVLGPTALAGQTQIAPVDQATMTKLAPTALDTAAQLNLANANQTRAQQEGLVGSLQGTIAGTNPSVAAILLRQETERNVANQYAQAQAATGMNTGLAERQAMINASEANQTSIGQQALLRAQEIATAQGQLSGTLQGLGTNDIGVASTQAGYQQQTGLANQSAVNTGNIQQLGADVQTKLANAGFVNTQNMTQAQLNQAVALANAGFKNTANTTQAQLDAAYKALNVTQANSVNTANADRSLSASTTNASLAQQVALANQASQNQVGLANASNSLQANTTNATLAQQVALANAAAGNNTNQTNAQLANATGIANAGYSTQTGIANANNTTSANTSSAQLANAVRLANASNQTSVSQSNAAGANQIAQGNQSANLVQQNINTTAKQNLASNALTASGQAITGSVGAAQAQATAAAAQAQANAAKLGAVAGGLATVLTKSDRRAKTEIGDGTRDVMKFLDAVGAYKYRYKDGTKPGEAPGRHWGIMAQDLERDPVGKSIVRNTPDGKMVDAGHAAMIALAGLAALKKRVEHRA